MPNPVDGALMHAMSGNELSRVRTEFRLRPPVPINQSLLESRGPTLLCNQVGLTLGCQKLAGFLHKKEGSPLRLSDSAYEQVFLDKNRSVRLHFPRIRHVSEVRTFGVLSVLGF
jgi:hypothetical protein